MTLALPFILRGLSPVGLKTATGGATQLRGVREATEGDWIFASGGDVNAATNSGVPVRKVTISPFMPTACCAAMVAIITVMDAASTDSRRGFQKEFETIIAAVIGGCLLTGGDGSAIGAVFGAIIFGLVMIGLTYTDFDQKWFQVFLGGMLLLAVLFNNAIRKRVTGER